MSAASLAMPPATETGWDTAPGLLEGATSIELTPDQCGLAYWIRSAAQGTWMGLVNEHAPDAKVPDYMREPGPLRSALMEEFAFRSVSEEIATRSLSDLVKLAPDTASMEFYATQLLDEARHSLAFRGHLVELGVPRDQLAQTIEQMVCEKRARVLQPLKDFGDEVIAQPDSFICGVVILTILVEGVLAPAAELSERKWRLLNPAAASIERGANIDEIRHLSVGSSVVRQHLLRNPGDKKRILDVILRGRLLWRDLPVNEVIYEREVLFQQGMREHRDVVEGYEIAAGIPLLATSPEQRLMMANEWSREMQDSRLTYMGLPEAIL